MVRITVPPALSLAALAVLTCLLQGCSPRLEGSRDAAAPVADGRYDSEFPTQPVSRYLAQITVSVLRLNSVAYYKTYSFGQHERVTTTGLAPGVLEAHESTSMYSSNTTSGTATVIASEGRRIALLTCAHVVSFPDTIYGYQYGPDHRPTAYLASVSVQKRLALYIASLPEGGVVEILAADRSLDLAVVGHTYEEALPLLPPVIDYPLGHAGDLDWGTFVYLFGYPSGNRVVTKAIVSSPHKDKRESFLVDAVFGRGFSGGICLAMRDGVPHFEIVGLIKMVPARTMNVVTPGRDHVADELDVETPYEGPFFIERRTEIEYGVTQAVSAEVVRSFLESNRQALAAKGFFLERILGSSGGS